ncbi:MAG: proline dehydrogenase [Chitinophagia bacterium]|nr:proline dehydrogenase [Chitinophagia bacterium]
MLPQFDDTSIAFQYRTNKELKRAHFLFGSMASPTLTAIGMSLTKLAIDWKLPVKPLIKGTLFAQFCGGETMDEAAQTAEAIGKYGVDTILDYGVEGKDGEAEYDKAVPEFIKAIEYASKQPRIPFISIKITGFARFALLEKIHAGSSLSAPESDEWQRIVKRITQICEAAAKHNIKVLIDAEESWIQKPVDDLANLMMSTFNRTHVVVYNTFQHYCHSRLAYLKASVVTAQKEGYLLGAKLVRGAYMEKERKRAEAMGYPSPIQPNKEATDADYNQAVAFCMENINHLGLFIGTHNEHSCLLAAKAMQDAGMNPSSDKVYFSQLYGMSDNISFNLAHHGYKVAKYLPYGPVNDVIPYLLRRAQENTSVAGQTGRELSLIAKEVKRRGI